MTTAILTWSRRLIIALMVPLAGAFGNVGPYIVALICIAVTLLLLVQGKLVVTYRQPLAALLLAAFAVLAACFVITAEAAGDAVYAFNFVMLLLAGPLLFAMMQGAGELNVRRFAWLAFAGASIALCLVVYSRSQGGTRGDGITLNPNRMANTAVLFGFLALSGLFARGGRERWLLLAAPAVGLAVTFVTESRGPLVAAVFMLPIAVGFGLQLLPRRFRLAAAAGALILVALGGVVVLSQERFARLPLIVSDMLSGSAVSDNTANIRLTLYRAAVQAFQQSPWVGHGWDELMTAILPFMDEQGRAYAAKLPQLHNDVLDFAVAGGIVGVVAYLLLLAAPLVAAWRSPRDSQRVARLYGASVLVASYFGAGLTDLMFGFEYHTALYVVLAVILIGYCRDSSEQSA